MINIHRYLYVRQAGYETLRIYAVSEKKMPDIIDCILKRDYRLLRIWGKWSMQNMP